MAVAQEALARLRRSQLRNYLRVGRSGNLRNYMRIGRSQPALAAQLAELPSVMGVVAEEPMVRQARNNLRNLMRIGKRSAHQLAQPHPAPPVANYGLFAAQIFEKNLEGTH